MLLVDVPSHLPKVMADAERTGQILRNLLNNAIIHTFPGGEITVRTRAHDDEVMVSVQDTGEGIAEEHLPNIFERFYRADALRSRATGGSGLGLAIVKQMVEAHHGRIEVESSPGTGSCFTFTLPLSSLTCPAVILSAAKDLSWSKIQILRCAQDDSRAGEGGQIVGWACSCSGCCYTIHV